MAERITQSVPFVGSIISQTSGAARQKAPILEDERDEGAILKDTPDQLSRSKGVADAERSTWHTRSQISVGSVSLSGLIPTIGSGKRLLMRTPSVASWDFHNASGKNTADDNCCALCPRPLGVGNRYSKRIVNGMELQAFLNDEPGATYDLKRVAEASIGTGRPALGTCVSTHRREHWTIQTMMMNA